MATQDLTSAGSPAIVLLCAIALLVAPVTILAQGSLTPLPSPDPDPALSSGGQPIPNMKTLTQVEPRAPIDAIHTPGDSASLFIVRKSGSYYLTGNVTGVAGRNGINVAAGNVTIDLNGFELAGVPSSVSGLRVISVSNVTIRNGVIRSWGSHGIDGSSSDNLRIENLCLVSNGGFGMVAGDYGTIYKCIAKLNASGGYNGEYHWLVHESQAIANTGSGFQFLRGLLMNNCLAANNTGLGIDAGTNAKVSRCSLQFNGNDGINVAGECVLLENHCDRNGGGSNAGIHVRGQHNRIESNELSLNNNRGLKVDNDFNVIIRNTVAPVVGGIPYDIASGNKVGVIIAATGSGAISGASGGVGMGTTDPWANFSY